MTVIVYRDGVMAADSRGYSGGRPPLGEKAKIFDIGSALVGISTTVPGLSERILEWIERGGGEENFPAKFIDGQGWSAIMVMRDSGKVYRLESTCYFSGPLKADFHAIGSGDGYALGAMEMGADAVKAVEVAIKFDVWSDGEIRTLHLQKQSG